MKELSKKEFISNTLKNYLWFNKMIIQKDSNTLDSTYFLHGYG